MPSVAQEVARAAQLLVDKARAEIKTLVGPVFNVKGYGARGDGKADDTEGIQAALDAASAYGGGKVYVPTGRYMISATLMVYSNTIVEGETGAVITAMPKMDTIMITNADNVIGNQNITIRNLTIDGDKGNQTPNVEQTGIKMVTVTDLMIEGVTVLDCVGHGIHISQNRIKDIPQRVRILNTVVSGSGIDPLSTWGSNLAFTDCNGVIVSNVISYGSAKAGFRPSGRNFVIDTFEAWGNANGNIVPVSGTFSDSVISNGIVHDSAGAIGHEDGIRMLGVERVTISNVTSHSNKGAGILVANACRDINIVNCSCYNNGQSEASPDPNYITGRDGITIRNDGAACERISIIGGRFFDNQQTPTQEYGISIRNDSKDITLEGCSFGPNKLGRLLNSAVGSGVVLRNVAGLSGIYCSHGLNAAVTGTTDETDLASIVIPGDELGRKGILRFTAVGSISGTSDTKAVRLYFGPHSDAFTFSASDVGAWMIRGTIANNSTAGTSQRYTFEFYKGDSLAAFRVGTITVDTTQDVLLKFTGKLSNAGDTIQQRSLETTYDTSN